MPKFEQSPPLPIRIGISACLLGQKVRFDGGHKEDRFITRTLGAHFEWVPVCPEVELGLGTPRESMRLEQAVGNTLLVVTNSRKNLTQEMQIFSRARVEALTGEDLSGYILKSNSPSCGMERVRIYGPGSMRVRTGRGIFANVLLKRFPNLPAEEEGRLGDPRLRENWIERVFAYHRLKTLWHSRWTIRSLIEFHTAHKLVLLAHLPRAYQELGKLVARAKDLARQQLRATYETEFMRALKVMATRGRHANVLLHMAGYLRKDLDNESRVELRECIEDYRRSGAPLIVPLTLIRHHVRRLKIAYLTGQAYLNPHPHELFLRNQI